MYGHVLGAGGGVLGMRMTRRQRKRPTAQMLNTERLEVTPSIVALWGDFKRLALHIEVAVPADQRWEGRMEQRGNVADNCESNVMVEVAGVASGGEAQEDQFVSAGVRWQTELEDVGASRVKEGRGKRSGGRVYSYIAIALDDEFVG
jgi:hypothetical protein